MRLEAVIFQALGGLGLFLLGMKFMSEGLQNVAGDRLRRFLEMVSSNRVVGALVGTLVTAAVQSSSVTTVTVVGFVNAGLINLTQALGVILGANVGTTVTAQIIAFKITALALPAIALGVGFKLFARRRKWRYVGEIILGFGLLFFGMEMMKNGFKPLRTDPSFISFFTAFDAESIVGILLCVITGAVLTDDPAIFLGHRGHHHGPGQRGPVEPARLGGPDPGGEHRHHHHRRVGPPSGPISPPGEQPGAHTMFNVLGVAYMVLIFPFFLDLVKWATGLMGTARPMPWSTENGPT